MWTTSLDPGARSTFFAGVAPDVVEPRGGAQQLSVTLPVGATPQARTADDGRPDPPLPSGSVADDTPRAAAPAGRDPLRVVIGGGGIAALEAALALRELAGDRVALTLVSPDRDVVLSPLAVPTAFGAERAPCWPLAAVARELRARHVRAAIAGVDADGHRVRLAGGGELGYDVLLLALGGRPYRPFTHVLTFTGEADATALAGVVADLEEGWSGSVAFVVPPGVSWTMPAYELALLTAREVSSMCIDYARITVVTPEERPLALFGPRASAVVSDLVARAGVAVECGAYVESVVPGRALELAPGPRMFPVQRVIALPRLAGPRLAGLPHDADGFLPVDDGAHVIGVADVFAAGDGTDFPIKQGGIAAQQADAAAEQIAAAAGAPVTPQPFRPLLQDWLTGGPRPLYLATPIAGGGGAGVAVEWDPYSRETKLAGRHLGAWVTAHHQRRRPRPARALSV